MSHPDYYNHKGHADHDPARGIDWKPRPPIAGAKLPLEANGRPGAVACPHRRNPVLAIFRRFLANQKEMEIAWQTAKQDIRDEIALHRYQLTLRRADRLNKAFETFLPE